MLSHLSVFTRVIVAFVLFWVFYAHAQQIEIVSVRSHGNGESESAAVKDAILQAIGQVSGERIAATSTVQTNSREDSKGQSEHSAQVSARIDSLIKGVVKSSTTLSVEKDQKNGNYRAVVDVRVASFKGSVQLDRIKLAIVMGSQPLPPALGNNAQPFKQALVNGISDKFVSSAKFAVLDRGQQEATQREFSLISSGSAGIENYARLESKAIADFLVIVDVSDLTFTPNALGRQRVKASVRAIVYDYSSGQIRQSVTSVSTKVMREGAISILGNELGSELSEKILENVFPPLVVGFDGNTVSLNAGKGQFEVGDVVSLSRQGAALRDPYTKEILGYAEMHLGEGVVESVLPKISVVRITEAKMKIDDPSQGDIVARRKLSNSMPSVSVGSGINEIQKSVSPITKKGDKNEDSDW